MKSYGDSTHRPRAVEPRAFRDQATGVTSSVAGSRATGAMRSAAVGACMPPAQRAAAPTAEGFDTSVAYAGGEQHGY